MSFDFRDLDLKRDKMEISVDGQTYSRAQEYDKVKNIKFSNQFGTVMLDGYFDVKYLNIPDIVKLSKYSLIFNKKFTEMNTVMNVYKDIRVFVTFNQVPIDSNIFNSTALNNYLKQMSANKSIVTGRLCIEMKDFKNIELSDLITAFTHEENLDRNRGFNIHLNSQPEEDDTFLNISKQKRLYKQDEGDYKSLDGEEMEKVNLREDEKEYEIPEDSSNDFIDFEKGDEAFEFTQKNNTDGYPDYPKFIDPYHLDSNDKMRRLRKDYRNNSFKVCFNHRGEFVTLGQFNKDNFKQQLSINKITPNKSLKNKTKTTSENLELYNKITIKSFYDIFHSLVQEKETSYLGPNEYTDIVDQYINNLLNAKKQIKENYSDDSKNIFLQKLMKEISILKLFKSLYLNCYKDEGHLLYNESVNYKSLREEVKRMRKKKLIDWLKENINEKDSSLIRTNQRQENIFGKIFNSLKSGNINKAVDLCNTNGLFMLSMIVSQTNFSHSNTLEKSIEHWKKSGIFEYFPDDFKKILGLFSGLGNISDINESDWKTKILSFSLFSIDPIMDISYITENFENSQKMSQDTNTSFNRDYNYQLIKYKSYLDLLENKHKVYDELVRELSNSFNIFDEFADHHVNYIIVTILLNTLGETYQPLDNEYMVSNQAINFNLLHKLHAKLLLKVTEELLLYEGDNWKYAVSLIQNSNLSAYNKTELINEIIFRRIDQIKHDEHYIKLVTSRDGEVLDEALALHFYSIFDYRNAYELFKRCRNFIKANEIFIFHNLCLTLNNKNLNNHLFDEIEYLSNYTNNNHMWEIYGKLFYDYLKVIRKCEDSSKIKNLDVDYLRGLIKKVEGLKTASPVHKNTINLVRSVMIGNLRKIYNRRKEFITSSAIHSYVTPNLNWIRDNEMTLDVKINEFNKAVDSQIDYKSFLFNHFEGETRHISIRETTIRLDRSII